MLTPWMFYIIIGLLVSAKTMHMLIQNITFEGFEDYLLTGTMIVIGVTLTWPAVAILLALQEYFMFKARQELEDEENEDEEPAKPDEELDKAA